MSHYLTTKVNFFKNIESEKLDSLAKKIETLEYEAGQICINFKSINNYYSDKIR